MKDFSKIKFNGTFREYQQRVIDNLPKHLKDKKVHIVAAPGSGKTILGLELIRMLGKPAIILSPTIAIREQWKERFEEMFVPEDENVDDYFSCSLRDPKLMTSITYQGLYTSYRRMTDAQDRAKQRAVEKMRREKERALAGEGDDAEGDDAEEPCENYTGLDIVKLIEEHKIATICLDEAHHLKAEWQRALYEFVAQVEHCVTVVSLTATPPYDSKKSEWDKYIAMCGPIDEEIFVPELVRAKALCPHQDYIYYNFPTEDEMKLIEGYGKIVDEAVQKIFEEGEFLRIIKNTPWYNDPEEFRDELEDRSHFVNAVLLFLQASREKPNKPLVNILEKRDRGGEWDLDTAQLLFQFMISDDQLFSKQDSEFVLGFLRRYGLVDKREVFLTTNPQLEKLLVSSIGKLNSIGKIVEAEWEDLGENLRLLILTDFIRVNSAVLGSDKEIKEMGVVPIFEMIRRKNLGDFGQDCYCSERVA
jgi:Rad3-related DNA helicase